MKLSVSWIFDHIDADLKKNNLEELADIFSKTTAEIESVRKVSTDLANFTIAQLQAVNGEQAILFSPELNSEIIISPSTVASNIDHKNGDQIERSQWFLLVKNGDLYRFATSTDLGGQKDMALPALNYSESFINGSWRSNFESEDYILEVSNISLTNRPDMWSHRGFAREFAILADANLKKSDDFLEDLEIVETSKDFLKEDDLELQIKDVQKCKRLAALKIEKIANVGSLLNTVVRLSRVDSRSINAIVDATNYTMLDIGQPMHAFDATVFSKKIVARPAFEGEKLVLLDGQEIDLVEDDLVIATDDKALSLAGIMGGKFSGVSSQTDSVILEAACFDASTIRKTSSRLKARSESSARYEKSLDPNQNIDAIRRFVKLFRDANLELIVKEPLFSIGLGESSKEIFLEHDFIESRLGISIDSDKVVSIFKSLGFDVEQDETTYKVVVPTYRSTKDIMLSEDLLEEVVRFYGYDKIPFILSSKKTEPHDISKILNLRSIKKFMAYSACMTELNSYPFLDEDFIKDFGLDLSEEKDLLEVLSPVSQNWKRLVYSLVPNLLRAIPVNLYRTEKMRFFELNSIWDRVGVDISEKKSLAGVVFNYVEPIDFYSEKSVLENLFSMRGINVSWTKTSTQEPWFDKNSSADIFVGDRCIGTAGLIDKRFLSKITDVGHGFVFELDAQYLIDFEPSDFKYLPICKYPEVIQDISIYVPISLTYGYVKNILQSSDDHIKNVELRDVFEKPEWQDKKSMTLRYYIVDELKTLTKEDISLINKRVNDAILNIGAQIR